MKAKANAAKVIAAVKALDQDVYGVLVIDSISHVWDACKNAFVGQLTKLSRTEPARVGGTVNGVEQWC